MQGNIPKVSEETKKRWNEEIAQKVQRKLERSSRRDDWGERLEAAACEEGLKEAKRLYDGTSRAHDIQAGEKPKLKSKHKDKEKSRKGKKRKHKSSQAEDIARKSSKKSRKSDPADRNEETIRCDDASKAPAASLSPERLQKGSCEASLDERMFGHIAPAKEFSSKYCASV